MRYRVEQELFEKVPDFCRAVVVGRGARNNGPAEELEELFRHDLGVIRADAGISVDDRRIQAWYRVHRTFPAAPGERIRPSIATLIRRTKGGGSDIPFISPLVAISNLVSLKYVVPSGLIDAARITGDLVLGYAAGIESFVPFGREEPSVALPGEVILYDSSSNIILCRAWNSRGGKSGGISPETSIAVIDIDGLLAVISRLTLGEAAEWVASAVQTYCGATTEIVFLDAERPEFSFAV